MAEGHKTETVGRRLDKIADISNAIFTNVINALHGYNQIDTAMDGQTHFPLSPATGRPINHSIGRYVTNNVVSIRTHSSRCPRI